MDRGAGFKVWYTCVSRVAVMSDTAVTRRLIVFEEKSDRFRRNFDRKQTLSGEKPFSENAHARRRNPCQSQVVVFCLVVLSSAWQCPTSYIGHLTTWCNLQVCRNLDLHVAGVYPGAVGWRGSQSFTGRLRPGFCTPTFQRRLCAQNIRRSLPAAPSIQRKPSCAAKEHAWAPATK